MDAQPLHNLRVVIVDRNHHEAMLLRGILRAFGIDAISILSNTNDALSALRKERFDVIFVEDKSQPENPLTFCRKMRTDLETKDPTTPVFLMCHATRLRAIELARDAGTNDVICVPFSQAVVKLKLQALQGMPRAFVASKSYLGPDRRKRDPEEAAGYVGGDRRRAAPEDVAIFTGRPRFE